MTSITSALSWLLLASMVVVGVLGAVSVQLSATGLVLGPVLLWIGARHRLAGAQLLWSAMTGTLPMASSPAACEVIRDTARAGLLAGVTGSLVVLLVGGPAVEVAAPVLVAVGLDVTLWRPLGRRLLAEYRRWCVGLKEALKPASIMQDVRVLKMA